MDSTLLFLSTTISCTNCARKCVVGRDARFCPFCGNAFTPTTLAADQWKKDDRFRQEDTREHRKIFVVLAASIGICLIAVLLTTSTTSMFLSLIACIVFVLLYLGSRLIRSQGYQKRRSIIS